MKELFVCAFFATLAVVSHATGSEKAVAVVGNTAKEVQHILNKYCTDCHGEHEKEGNVSLHDFSQLGTGFQSELLNKIEEQLYLEQMPPEDADQPSETERQHLFASVKTQFEILGERSTFREKLRTPHFGNYVNHEKLFSGEYKDLKAFTPARRWLISPYIFEAKFNQLLNYKPFRTIDGKRRYVIGDNNRGVTLTNFTQRLWKPHQTLWRPGPGNVSKEVESDGCDQAAYDLSPAAGPVAYETASRISAHEMRVHSLEGLNAVCVKPSSYTNSPKVCHVQEIQVCLVGCVVDNELCAIGASGRSVEGARHLPQQHGAAAR